VFNKIKSNKMLNSTDRINKIYPNKESFEMVKNNFLD